MNVKSTLIATLIGVVAGGAWATSKSPAELQQEAELRRPSMVTRAQVQAELARARTAGTLNVHPDYGTRAVATSPDDGSRRARVQAELAQARADGTLNVHPDHGTRAVTGSSSLTRAQVQAEVRAAMAAGARLSQGEKN